MLTSLTALYLCSILFSFLSLSFLPLSSFVFSLSIAVRKLASKQLMVLLLSLYLIYLFLIVSPIISKFSLFSSLICQKHNYKSFLYAAFRQEYLELIDRQVNLHPYPPSSTLPFHLSSPSSLLSLGNIGIPAGIYVSSKKVKAPRR